MFKILTLLVASLKARIKASKVTRHSHNKHQCNMHRSSRNSRNMRSSHTLASHNRLITDMHRPKMALIKCQTQTARHIN
uniref:Uncharacterized protein n=1 Tax=uncultured marine virus TaxID=186617 RepID=A0A0F7L480_9VIRU|nr:hypothetical protein [uncultured marine virus]